MSTAARSEFRLPDLGEGLTEAEILRWLVSPGDRVEVNQPLVEVETAKAAVEIPSPAAGIVAHLGADEGQMLAVGSVLLVFGTGDAEAEPADERAAEPAAAPAAAP